MEKTPHHNRSDEKDLDKKKKDMRGTEITVIIIAVALLVIIIAAGVYYFL